VNLQTFDFNEAPVRVLLRDEMPWFVAADVCRVLEIANSRDAVGGLDEDEKATVGNADALTSNVATTDIKIPNRGLQIISESGLYALVFKSRKPEARKFRKWVTAEVLPALRQTGRYEIPRAVDDPESVSLLRFVRESCQGWTLDRQMEFGMQARRYAKSMGVVFQTGCEPGVGRVFVFSRVVLEAVRLSFQRTILLSDTESVEFERLLEALHRADGVVSYEPEVARGVAKTMGLFPRIFAAGASVESERAAFGRMCERYNGRIFPSGLSLEVRASGVRRRYQISRRAHEMALPS